MILQKSFFKKILLHFLPLEKMKIKLNIPVKDWSSRNTAHTWSTKYSIWENKIYFRVIENKVEKWYFVDKKK